MSDALSAIGGFALIVGLFVAYVVQRVSQRRAKAPQPPPAILPPPVETAAAAAPTGQSHGSINWGAPFLYCILLTVAARAGTVWSTICLAGYALFVIVGAHSTFSPKELAAEQRRRPGTTRWEHYARLGFPYVLVPTVSLVLVLSGQAWAVLLPALPWVLIILLAVVVLPATAVMAWIRRLTKRSP